MKTLQRWRWKAFKHFGDYNTKKHYDRSDSALNYLRTYRITYCKGKYLIDFANQFYMVTGLCSENGTDHYESFVSTVYLLLIEE
jgi:hypothetical protein